MALASRRFRFGDFFFDTGDDSSDIEVSLPFAPFFFDTGRSSSIITSSTVTSGTFFAIFFVDNGGRTPFVLISADFFADSIFAFSFACSFADSMNVFFSFAGSLADFFADSTKLFSFARSFARCFSKAGDRLRFFVGGSSIDIEESSPCIGSSLDTSAISSPARCSPDTGVVSPVRTSFIEIGGVAPVAVASSLGRSSVTSTMSSGLHNAGISETLISSTLRFHTLLQTTSGRSMEQLRRLISSSAA